jgi:hypothetical protein
LESQKAEGLAESLELPPVIEIVDGSLWSYFGTLASQHKLTNPGEVHETISVLKVGNTTGPNGISNRALKHLPQGDIPGRRDDQCCPPQPSHPHSVKKTRVISTLKTGNHLAIPSSYWTISLFDAIGNLFENMILTRNLSEVAEGGLMRDEQIEFRTRHRT